MSDEKRRPVLVVEDVEEISTNMRDALKRRGHDVVLASDADQAIKLAEAKRPAMILTDLELPTFEKLMKLLRAHNDLKNVAVAILDINAPEISDEKVRVVRSLEALDDLISASVPSGNQ